MMNTKKILSILSFVLVCNSFAFSQTNESKSQVVTVGIPEVIDYKGKALGSDVPAWVKAASDGAFRKIYKSLEIDMAEDKIFVLYNKGNDLDFLKTWTDQVDARAEVSAAIEQTVAQTVESELKVIQADTQTKERKAKIYSASMTNLTLNGLMKEADYWIKTRTPKVDVKNPESASDYTIEYTYYVVFSINKANFDRQISSAMDDVSDNDDQTKFLKSVLTQKLKESIITNKDPEIINFKNAKVEEIDDELNVVK
ncbi:MAG: hypothetical protein J6B11_10335 [Spirochaetales bacterium]|nr:hypothetical protein [Spirochaetales bacterium]